MEGLIADGDAPTSQCGALLVLDDVLHDILPSAFGDGRIRAGQVGHANFAIEQRMAQGFILVEDQPFGFGAILGLQTRAGTGGDVFAIKGTTTITQLNQSVSCVHVSLQYGRERNRAKKDCARVAPDSAGIRPR